MSAKTYNVHPVRESRGSFLVECDDDDPRRIAFGLYIRHPDGCLEHIQDYPTREEAEGIARQLGELEGRSS